MRINIYILLLLKLYILYVNVKYYLHIKNVSNIRFLERLLKEFKIRKLAKHHNNDSLIQYILYLRNSGTFHYTEVTTTLVGMLLSHVERLYKLLLFFEYLGKLFIKCLNCR